MRDTGTAFGNLPFLGGVTGDWKNDGTCDRNRQKVGLLVCGRHRAATVWKLFSGVVGKYPQRSKKAIEVTNSGPEKLGGLGAPAHKGEN